MGPPGAVRPSRFAQARSRILDPWRGLSPTRLFMLFSISVMLVVGALQAAIIGDRVRQQTIDVAVALIGANVRSTVRQQLSADDFASPLLGARYQAFDSFIRQNVLSDLVKRVKVWNTQGMVIYADDVSLIGRVYEIEDELAEALGENAITADVSSLQNPENVGEQGLGPLLEVYVPLVPRDGTSVVGAYEVYLSYEPIAIAIRETQAFLLISIGAAMLGLWLALSWVFVGSSRRIAALDAGARHQAEHDALTGLPNRAQLEIEVQRVIRLIRPGEHFALLTLGLDNFKDINLTYGHDVGDGVLREIGLRLRAQVRDRDTVARLGGDVFSVVLPGADGVAATRVGSAVLASLERPIQVKERGLDAGGGVGIALYPEHGESAETLIRHAVVAMHAAKRSSDGQVTYSPSLEGSTPAHPTLMSELRSAIDGNEMVLYFQPKADLATGRLVGMEALCRWQSPVHGLLLPAAFLPLAERSGMIRRLTEWVLVDALRECRVWSDGGLDLPVAVNVSVRDLVDPAFPALISRSIASSGVSPRQLTLEVTESVVMTDPKVTREVLGRLRALGVRVSIDDFGTGYSSLSYLQQLPVDELKIDRSFVAAMVTDAASETIVRATIELAHALRFLVVAEGVEDRGAWDRLVALGCDTAQGYYLSRPLSPEAIGPWLTAQSAPTTGGLFCRLAA